MEWELYSIREEELDSALESEPKRARLATASEDPAAPSRRLRAWWLVDPGPMALASKQE